MRVEYTELEREKLARINAQLQVLQLQANQLFGERNELYKSILSRAKLTLKQGAEAKFFNDHLEAPDIEKPEKKTK